MPFCPACGLRAAPGASRCGLDGHWMARARCRQCGGEVMPADRYCGWCRCDLVRQPAWQGPAEFAAASVRRRIGAAAFDLLTVGFAWSWLFDVASPWLRLAGLLLTPLLVAFCEVGGTGSPGQQIFGLRRLRADGSALAVRDLGLCLAAALRLPAGRALRLFRVQR